MIDHLSSVYPVLGERLPKLTIADLPTPVEEHTIETPAGQREILVKRDDLSSTSYGGNKIRKLEYVLRRAIDRGAKRVATFGAAGSNHALATSIHARNANLECTCFLAHQSRTPKVPITLNMHRQIGTEIVRYGHGIETRPLFRKYLQHRNAWVIPLGGSSWLGAVGFVNAGLELASQISAGDTPCPERIYIANGTMGSVAGLLLGLAVAELAIDVHAVRVVEKQFTNLTIQERLLRKTASLLHRYDPKFDETLADPARLCWRDNFCGPGYAKVDEPTQRAVLAAETEAGMRLETTYTGKAMAALLHDLQQPEYDGGRYLFWNTHNSIPLPVTADKPDTPGNIPDEFLNRYFSADAGQP